MSNRALVSVDVTVTLCGEDHDFLALVPENITDSELDIVEYLMNDIEITVN